MAGHPSCCALAAPAFGQIAADAAAACNAPLDTAANTVWRRFGIGRKIQASRLSRGRPAQGARGIEKLRQPPRCEPPPLQQNFSSWQETGAHRPRDALRSSQVGARGGSTASASPPLLLLCDLRILPGGYDAARGGLLGHDLRPHDAHQQQLRHSRGVLPDSRDHHPRAGAPGRGSHLRRLCAVAARGLAAVGANGLALLAAAGAGLRRLRRLQRHRALRVRLPLLAAGPRLISPHSHVCTGWRRISAATARRCWSSSSPRCGCFRALAPRSS